MVVNGQKIAWNDVDVVRQMLGALG
jgi:hypothetical protein